MSDMRSDIPGHTDQERRTLVEGSIEGAPVREDGVNRVAQQVKDSANQIWLAGLGAFARAEDEGYRLFNNLVEDGEKLDQETRKVVGGSIRQARTKVGRVRERAKEKATDSWCRFEKAFDERVAKALSQLHIPSQADVDRLNRQIATLEKTLRDLGEDV